MTPARPSPVRALVSRSRHSRRDDTGSITLYWLLLAPVLFGLLALVVDGTGLDRARAHAEDLAAEAARSAGQQIDLAQAIPGQAIVIDPDAAQQAAKAFLAQAGAHGTVNVSADGTRITVDVTDTYAPQMIPALNGVSVTGHSSAALIRQLEG
ncbi:TadE/TadG family type IV pilus assembly protein [Streptomyces sp. NBC_01789]|uniref:TadE/TadG family type IV pilus assembly protein n=1 Tax=Streptomyces sp. NBC_01789 TaxID=2975941 RepID=UPI0022503FF7|nr:pilus assembly protein TadG-related protein [Streptomyces sp. NBC_01789]MCX4451683.1 pilus assembly protein TadG-related protein [Streptomyces sp. NBC_01789]